MLDQTPTRVGAGERAVLPGVGSVAWRIHREIVILLAWGRAILLQFAHPLVARGVADHSPFRTERWGRFHRLYRTLDAMLRLTFGTAEEAERVARRINGIHDRIHGRLGEAAAGLPEGTPYSAHDPALLKWVHATLLESHLLVYELYVGALTPEEKDRYCAETTGMESLLGMPEGYLPRSLAGLQDYISGTLGSGEIAVTDVARELGREIVSLGLPRVARPLTWVAELPTIGLLPPAIRDAYGFRWGPRQEKALHISARVIQSALPFVPSALRCWPRARAAFRRNNR